MRWVAGAHDDARFMERDLWCAKHPSAKARHRRRGAVGITGRRETTARGSSSPGLRSVRGVGGALGLRSGRTGELSVSARLRDPAAGGRLQSDSRRAAPGASARQELANRSHALSDQADRAKHSPQSAAETPRPTVAGLAQAVFESHDHLRRKAWY